MTDRFASYIICGTPRSGSTLLCEMLWATRTAGRPHSYYREQDVLYWADKWGVPHPEGSENAAFDRAYLAAVVREGSAETGILGIRVMWSSMGDTLKRLSRATSSSAGIAEQFEGAFGHILYVHVTRDDKIAQAVSRLRAEQSGLWHVAADGSVLEGIASPRPVSYDRARIAQYVAQLNNDDTAWNNFFAHRQIEPLRLNYETTIADPTAALRKVLTSLHLDPEKARDIPVATARMADDKSESWIERFREENGA